MATFLQRVQALSGTVSSTSELDTWLSDGVIDVINRIRIVNSAMLFKFAQATTLGSTGLALATGMDVLDVARGDYESYEIPPSLRHRASRSTSFYQATVKTPKHYYLNNRLYSLPFTTGNYATASYILPDTVANTDTAISNFPSEAYHLVALYAAIRNVIAQLEAITFPSDLTPPVLPTIDVSTMSGLTISSLTVTAVPPVMEDFTLSDGTITAFGTAPSFTDPTDLLTGTPTITLGSPPVYAGPTKLTDLATVTSTISTYIDTDEDLVQAETKLAQMGTVIQAFATDIQDAVNEFNEQNTQYQAELQKGIAEIRAYTDTYTSRLQGAIASFNEEVEAYRAAVQKNIKEAELLLQSDTAETQIKLNEFMGKIDIYKTEVNNELTEYARTVEAEITEWTTNRSNLLQEYVYKTQAEVSLFNAQSNEFMARINKQNADLARLIALLNNLRLDYNAGFIPFEVKERSK